MTTIALLKSLFWGIAALEKHVSSIVTLKDSFQRHMSRLLVSVPGSVRRIFYIYMLAYKAFPYASNLSV